VLEKSEAWDVCGCPYFHLAELIDRHSPRVVVIMVGTNDLADARGTCQEITRDIVKLHQFCHGRGVRTLALGVPPNEFTGDDDLVSPTLMQSLEIHALNYEANSQ
jgi:lysophospholipase L1-like esterase